MTDHQNQVFNEPPTEAKVIELKPEHMLAIKNELEILNGHKLVKTYNSLPRLLSFQFAKGIAFGLGSVVGATVVVSILAYILSHIEFIPIVGEWMLLLMDEIQETQHIKK